MRVVWSAAVSAAHGVGGPERPSAHKFWVHHVVGLLRNGQGSQQFRSDGVSRRDGGAPTAWLRLRRGDKPPMFKRVGPGNNFTESAGSKKIPSGEAGGRRGGFRDDPKRAQARETAMNRAFCLR